MNDLMLERQTNSYDEMRKRHPEMKNFSDKRMNHAIYYCTGNNCAVCKDYKQKQELEYGVEEEMMVTISHKTLVLKDSKGRVCCSKLVPNAIEDGEQIYEELCCDLDGWDATKPSCGVYDYDVTVDQDTQSVPAPPECPIIKQIQVNKDDYDGLYRKCSSCNGSTFSSNTPSQPFSCKDCLGQGYYKDRDAEE